MQQRAPRMHSFHRPAGRKHNDLQAAQDYSTAITTRERAPGTEAATRGHAGVRSGRCGGDWQASGRRAEARSGGGEGLLGHDWRWPQAAAPPHAEAGGRGDFVAAMPEDPVEEGQLARGFKCGARRQHARVLRRWCICGHKVEELGSHICDRACLLRVPRALQAQCTGHLQRTGSGARGSTAQHAGADTAPCA
jgi:hypothetical protein